MNDRLQELAPQHGGLHPGMTSPDSTQAALDAETGEPDAQARGMADGAAMRHVDEQRASGDLPPVHEDDPELGGRRDAVV